MFISSCISCLTTGITSFCLKNALQYLFEYEFVEGRFSQFFIYLKKSISSSLMKGSFVSYGWLVQCSHSFEDVIPLPSFFFFFRISKTMFILTHKMCHLAPMPVKYQHSIWLLLRFGTSVTGKS